MLSALNASSLSPIEGTRSLVRCAPGGSRVANGPIRADGPRTRMIQHAAALLLAVLLAVVGLIASGTDVEADDGHMAPLEARLQQLIDQYPVHGEYAVAVTDLQSGRTIGVNADRWQLAGCSI